MATGPVLVRYDNATKAPIPLDALYLLDNRTGRLQASLPIFRQSGQSTTIIESFVARDLAVDFKVDFNRGESPRFLMTTGSLGPHTAGSPALRDRNDDQSNRRLPPAHRAHYRDNIAPKI